MNRFDMSGALFPNDKDGVETRPDFRGDITIAGVKYTLAAWKKQGKVKNYLSLAATEFKETKADA